MKKIILSFVCFFLLFNSYSQHECGTITPNIDFLEEVNPNLRSGPWNNATVQVYIHIVRKNNGGGSDVISTNEAMNGFIQMQNRYSPHNICFVLKGIGYINKTKFYNFTDADFNSLTGTNISSDAIDIYIVPNRPTNVLAYRGKATGIPGRAFVIQRNPVTNGSTMAHEMGHCLGLYHTHETSFCSEAINGSNCSTCGDLVCDTPADPVLSDNKVNSSCVYTGGGGYSPLTQNIMSYSRLSCRTDFTDGQKNRILSIIPNSSLLSARLAPSDITISNITFPYTLPPFINVSSFNFIAKNSISTLGNVLIQNGANINLLAEYEITLTPGFDVSLGAEFCAKIDETCPPSINCIAAPNPDDLKDESEASVIIDEYNILNDNVSLAENNSFIYNSISVFPNPSNGKFTLLLHPKFDYSNAMLSIYDEKGKIIDSRNITNNNIDIDISKQGSGIFYIQILTSDKKVITKKAVTAN
jgi:hypothetical protein